MTAPRFGDTAGDTLQALHRAADRELADDGGIAPLPIAQVLVSTTLMTPAERRWHDRHPVTLTMCDPPSDPETLRALMVVGNAAGMAMATEEPEETMNQELEDEGPWPHRCGPACGHLLRELHAEEVQREARKRRWAIRLIYLAGSALLLWALFGWAST